MIKFCPRCNQSYTVGFDCTDYVHECNSGNDAIDNEDVLVIGDWEDYSGSGNNPNALLQGAENELQGTEAGIQGTTKHAVTRRGNTATTHRQRQHFEFINIENERFD